MLAALPVSSSIEEAKRCATLSGTATDLGQQAGEPATAKTQPPSQLSAGCTSAAQQALNCLTGRWNCTYVYRPGWSRAPAKMARTLPTVAMWRGCTATAHVWAESGKSVLNVSVMRVTSVLRHKRQQKQQRRLNNNSGPQPPLGRVGLAGQAAANKGASRARGGMCGHSTREKSREMAMLLPQQPRQFLAWHGWHERGGEGRGSTCQNCHRRVGGWMWGSFPATAGAAGCWAGGSVMQSASSMIW